MIYDYGYDAYDYRELCVLQKQHFIRPTMLRAGEEPGKVKEVHLCVVDEM